MTEEFYERKRAIYMASPASDPVKKAAIEALDKAYLGTLSVEVARKDMDASAPDYEIE